MNAGPRQLPLPWPHVPSSTREDLVVGEANRLAVAAVDAWPHWPHPVLFLAGPPGSGKSHLGAAWSETARAELFRPGGFDALREGFAVFLDDLDRREFDEGEVFALVNAARLGGGTVLVTSRRRPPELEISTPDLHSRLQAATIAVLSEPDDALLAAILTKLFADRQIELDPRLLSLMLTRMERSLDAARRLVERVDRETLASGRRPTRRLLIDLLAQDGEKAEGPS